MFQIPIQRATLDFSEDFSVVDGLRLGYGPGYFGDGASMGDGPRIGHQHFNPQSLIPALVSQMKKDAEWSRLGNRIPAFAIQLGVRKDYITSGLVKTAPQGSQIISFIKWSTSLCHPLVSVSCVNKCSALEIFERLALVCALPA